MLAIRCYFSRDKFPLNLEIPQKITYSVFTITAYDAHGRQNGYWGNLEVAREFSLNLSRRDFVNSVIWIFPSTCGSRNSDVSMRNGVHVHCPPSFILPHSLSLLLLLLLRLPLPLSRLLPIPFFLYSISQERRHERLDWNRGRSIHVRRQNSCVRTPGLCLCVCVVRSARTTAWMRTAPD